MLLSLTVLARVAPFALFMVLLASDEPLGQVMTLAGLDARWAYFFRAGIAAMCLAWFWRHYSELRSCKQVETPAWPWAVAVGFAVLLLWILPYPDWALQGKIVHLGSPKDEAGNLDWAWVGVRFAGTVLVVPVMEELFWRSFLMRWVDYSRFMELKPSSVTVRSVVVTSAVFGVVHNLWLAGFVAGMAYGWLYRRYENLWVPTLAHAVTNAALGVWVVAYSQWHYW